MNPSKIKYTKELLESICKESTSVAQVANKLGLRSAGGTQCHIKKKIIQYGINIDHFLGNRTNSGPGHIGGFQKIEAENIFVIDRLNGTREKAFKLRRALLESDVKHECEVCGLGPLWMGKYLQLEIDHKNGNFLDNTKENLRFLCANCHTQTSNFGRTKQKIK